VVNRGVDKRQLFFQAADYEEFMVLLVEAVSRFAVDVFGYIVMPNHFHLLLRQRSEGAISAALRRVSGGSACHCRRTTSTVGLGPVYQRRVWRHVISDEQHCMTGLRYVEDNARQGAPVRRAEDWQWGSLWERVTGGRRVLAPSLVQLPENWVELVNQGLSVADLKPYRSPTLARQAIHSPAGCPPGGPVPVESRTGTCR
jgi:putative transposase